MIEYENLKKSNLPFFNAYKEKFESVLNSGWFVLGKEVSSFEEEFAQYCGVNYCVGVASGLDALYISLKVLDLPEGAEVIVPSNTYIATILSIIHAGLKPVLVDPDINTYNINPELIEEHISSSTRVIMVVHLYGKMCDMDKICEISHKYNLKLVEDCAQAHGSSYKGRKAGSFGDFGAFSFYPTKNLGSLGDGGAITTNSAKLAEKLRIFRNYGSRVKYKNEVVGVNSRLDELQAAFLRVKLPYLDTINTHKRKLAEIYRKNLNPGYILPIEHSDFFDIYHIFNIRHAKRDSLKSFLLKRGINTEIHYPVLSNKQEAMKKFLHTESSLSEEIHNTTLSLPISFYHTVEDIYSVSEALNDFLKYSG